ncbi:MAG: DUF2797 domain-containing protein, partial [Selenomonadaceae bacterium]|nr:DUF2797 domain-containing protein [Selenomonadaceae bacterium]
MWKAAFIRSLTSSSKYDRIEGVLSGIKGQYLIFDNGAAFNVRSHSGYRV